MASNGIRITFLIVVLVTMQMSIAMAQSSCTNVLISMSPCLNYVTGSSSTPSSSCCSQLAAVVRSQPQCLCVALNGGASSLGININKTLALELPSACNVQTPPVSECNAINQSNLSPAGSPGVLPGGSKAAAPNQSGSPKTNGLINKSLLLPLFLFVVLVASSGPVNF